MKTVILCGGRGTRMAGAGFDSPKALVPIGPRPILWHVMKYYASFGHTEFILCLGFKGEAIRRYFLDYDRRENDLTIALGATDGVTSHGRHAESGWRITLADTGENTMTGGRLRRIRQYLTPGESFFLTYADGLADVDLDALLRFHRSHEKSLSVTGVRPPGRFGEIRVDPGDQRVTAFAEKPKSTDSWISGGFFVAQSSLLESIEDNDLAVLERDPMERLVAEDQVRMYRHDGFWQCMDTPQDYEILSDLWPNRAPWKRW